MSEMWKRKDESIMEAIRRLQDGTRRLQDNIDNLFDSHDLPDIYPKPELTPWTPTEESAFQSFVRTLEWTSEDEFGFQLFTVTEGLL
jgi:hypothetical protein